MEDFQAKDEVNRLPCSHHFHPECISRWLRLVSLVNSLSFSIDRLCLFFVSAWNLSNVSRRVALTNEKKKRDVTRGSILYDDGEEEERTRDAHALVFLFRFVRL